MKQPTIAFQQTGECVPGRPRPIAYWDERRTNLLRAAREEVAESGVEGLTLERVARRAGVSKGSVQYAFGSKEQLLGELARDTLFGIFSDGVAARTATGSDLAGVVDGLSEGLAADEGRLIALLSMMATARRSESTRAALAGFYAEADPIIAAALRDGGVEVAEEAMEVLVRGLRGVVIGMFIHWVVHPQGRELPDVAAEVRFVLERLMGHGALEAAEAG